MRYPLFTFPELCYTMVPDIEITSHHLDCIQEMYMMFINPKPLYVFIGTKRCYIYVMKEIEILSIPIDISLPDTYTALKFTSESDPSECEIKIKKLSDKFRNEMVNILQNISSTVNVNMIIVEK